MVLHLLGLVFAVQDRQLSEHAHVSPFQPQSSLQEVDELREVASVLVVLFTLVSHESLRGNCPIRIIARESLNFLKLSVTYLFQKHT